MVLAKLRVTVPHGTYVSQEDYCFPQLASPAFEGAYYLTHKTLLHVTTSAEVCSLAEQVISFAEACISRAHELLLDKAHQLACSAGCAHCCSHLRVSLTAPEIFLIHRYLHSNDMPMDLPSLKESLRMFCDERDAQLPPGFNYHKDTGDPLTCPFLQEKRCTIYPVRPISCRGYNSCDAGQCQQYIEQRLLHFSPPVFRPQYEMAKGVSCGIQFALQQQGFQQPNQQIDFVPAILRTFEVPSAVKRWLGKNDIFTQSYVDAEMSKSCSCQAS